MIMDNRRATWLQMLVRLATNDFNDGFTEPRDVDTWEDTRRRAAQFGARAVPPPSEAELDTARHVYEELRRPRPEPQSQPQPKAA